MTLDPITYTEKVVGGFLRYELTTYPFADARLYAQMGEPGSKAQVTGTSNSAWQGQGT